MLQISVADFSRDMYITFNKSICFHYGDFFCMHSEDFY